LLSSESLKTNCTTPVAVVLSSQFLLLAVLEVLETIALFIAVSVLTHVEMVIVSPVVLVNCVPLPTLT
jgi:hypothetical protein